MLAMTPFNLEALDEAAVVVPALLLVVAVVLSFVVIVEISVAISVLAKAVVPVKLTIVAIATSSMADRMLVDMVFLDVIVFIIA
jgi:hypothetical protein